MNNSTTNLRIKQDTLDRLKKIKSLIEVEQDIYFESLSDAVDFLIEYRRNKGFTLKEKEF